VLSVGVAGNNYNISTAVDFPPLFSGSPVYVSNATKKYQYAEIKIAHLWFYFS